jgi:hypothetical protein
MSNPVNGTAVNFGFLTTVNGITITGISGTLLQSADHMAKADVEIVRDGTGAEVVHAHYNDHDEATLEWIITGSGLAAAITNTALIRPGAFVVITACASMPQLIATTWEARDGVKISGTNTNSKRFSLPITKYPGVTAVASA